MPRTRVKKPELELRLYVAGNGPNSILARTNIVALCEKEFCNIFVLEVVDLLDFPLRALADGIVVTPTLMKLSPAPVQRIIGNLSNTEQVLLTLRGA